jgi:hypothetical protein
VRILIQQKPVFGAGSAFQYLGLTLPDKLIATTIKATDAGGSIVPHWFLEKDFVEVPATAHSSLLFADVCKVL